MFETPVGLEVAEEAASDPDPGAPIEMEEVNWEDKSNTARGRDLRTILPCCWPCCWVPWVEPDGADGGAEDNSGGSGDEDDADEAEEVVGKGDKNDAGDDAREFSSDNDRALFIGDAAEELAADMVDAWLGESSFSSSPRTPPPPTPGPGEAGWVREGRRRCPTSARELRTGCCCCCCCCCCCY